MIDYDLMSWIKSGVSTDKNIQVNNKIHQYDKRDLNNLLALSACVAYNA